MIRIVQLLCLSGFLLLCEGQGLQTCLTHPTYRPAENADITVVCGTSHMFLKVFICPMYFGGYNESLMALNAKFNVPACRGVADWTVNPPVLLFNFSISQEVLTLCGNNMNITSQVGSGVFSDFSQIQSVNVSGLINSWDPSTSTITYRQQLMYQFSCLYPLQYLVNNTELSVSGVSLAVKDNNGTFVSTLSMGLYSTADYTTKLQIPGSGLQLKTRIYVQVKATNLTNKFNVLLDRCYATTSPYPTSSTSYDLFIGCNRDAQTKIDWNGISQVALFSFEAFRFVEHKNLSISTFYLHCATRLCENSTCASLLPRCVRKREVQSPVQNSSDVATVSSGPISTRVDNAGVVPARLSSSASIPQLTYVGVATGLLSFFLFDWLSTSGLGQ
ncbi:zona pellucida-like domain-containing protein 1 [Sinocyclocheilus anshuiensis]|uniref:Zona pellucida-like domain-containing protein 1 n=1 Tax=Sinocyclocheilus anshuiensis TaxID=1608454 RepID=A0A671RPS7_9TELE|nr:PREDICTED: zona pellucida-like domain-containing protein 1 [Sinocyclocheilus anshuiensis]XP_016308352.1 PREDICTED: zona pellucida-like domain-containing protein 1 [Sinocyclocheilus anshuiensis]